MITENLFWALPVLLTALLGSILTRKHKEKERFNSACDTFLSAFTNELAFLVSDIKPNNSIHGTTHDILTKALNNHRHAVDMFMRVLPKRKRKGFNKAWESYLYPNGYNKDADFPLLDYADYAAGNDFETRKFAHSKITDLLKYAK